MGDYFRTRNDILLHARLNKKFFNYVKYAQRIHDITPAKDLCDKNGLTTTPYFLLSGFKLNVDHFKILGCPTVFKT